MNNEIFRIKQEKVLLNLQKLITDATLTQESKLLDELEEMLIDNNLTLNTEQEEDETPTTKQMDQWHLERQQQDAEYESGKL